MPEIKNEESLIINLVDAQGQVKSSGSYTTTAETTISVPINQFSPGLYFLILNINNDTYTEKVIIQ
jgi:hypothetical protein